MATDRKSPRIVRVAVIMLGILMVMVAADLVITGSVLTLFQGPKYVMSAKSPDGAYEAYVVDEPAFDGPNQVLYVERSSKRNYVYLGHLAGDVDTIQDIKWSPDGNLVVFHSRDWLTASRVGDWKTVRIYLGREWMRTQAKRESTFTSGGATKVESIKFLKNGGFEYKLKGSVSSHTVTL